MRIQGFYNNLTIRKKLLFIFGIQILIPIVLLCFLMFQKSESVIRNQALSLTQDTFKVLEMRFLNFSNQLETVSQDFLYDDIVYEVLNNDRQDKFQYYGRVNALKTGLRKTTLSRDVIQSITFVTRDREFYSYDLNSGRANIEKMIPYDYLLQLARKAEGRLIWYIDKTKHSNNVFVARIVNDRDLYQEIGLMAILVDLSELEKNFNNLSSDILQDILVVGENGEEVISRWSDEPIVFSQLSHNLEKQTGAFYSGEKRDKLITYRKFDEPKWTIITGISRQVLMKDFTSLLTWIGLILTPLLFLLSVLSIKTGMTIISPINRLVTGMKSVKKGEKHEPIIIERNDELGYLSRTFNEMSEEIDHLVTDIYKEQLTRKEVELKALQAQINPHFLFNTLETINWRAQLKGAPEISKMVTALSSIMEASIGRDNKLITLKEELSYIDNYMSIMSYRFEGKLQYYKDVDPKLLTKKIPRLLLQPILENSINHGIGKSSKGGEIHIKAYLKEEDFIIEINDNGCGIDKDKLACLNYELVHCVEDSYRDVNRRSVGLTNVNQRIRLFYGDNYGMAIESVEDQYTTVRLNIPFNFVKKGDRYYVQSTSN